MLDVIICPPVTKKSIAVRVISTHENLPWRATLLGATGQQLKIFPLSEKDNELPLDGFAAGAYTLRIEAGNEIIARQIVIP